MGTAQITGTQRKVVDYSVRPERLAHGSSGIPILNGKTLGFVVSRSWSAPSGVAPESFFIIDPESREVLYESPVRDREIWGLQSMTEVVQTIREPFALDPGKYAIVFALGGVKGGEFPVEAFEISAEGAS